MVTVTRQVESRPDPRRWWALGALVASMLVLGFDMTILNVALPTIAEDLGATTGQQQWMADAYIVVFAALMLPAGLLGDRFGRRRMLIAGLGVFLAASVVGAFAGDVNRVIAARALMGVGGAFVMPLAISVLPSLFPREEQTKAIGMISAASALGMPLGPIIGGWLLNHFWWGSVFVLNVPMVAIGIVACLLLLPESRDPASPKVDVVSTVLTALGLGSLIYAIIEGPAKGWSDTVVIGGFAAAVALIGALVLRERRGERPMLDLTLLGNRTFLSNTLAATLGMFVLSGLMFLLPQYLQAVLGTDPLGTDPLGTGVRMIPMMGGMLVAAKLAQPLVVKFGARSVIVVALVVLAFAAFLGARTTVDSGYGFTALWLSIAGIGVAFAMIPAMGGALGALAKDQAGRGSGLLSTVRQTGSALGVALLGALVVGAYTDRLSTAGLPGPAADAARDSVIGAHVVAGQLGDRALAASANSAYVHGMDVALVVIGIVALAAALLAAALMPGSVKAAPVLDPEVAPISADA
ncbi:DHA2 family efflux MFS transporter permease subunit [Streptomyces sp. SID8379]|uniref:DHA2 family efflux MFS transporter permease subunit n=1 Tax=unclassified Streptomyces TaxID=2593676 RepID=UPI0004779EFF|nr:MULTISPECIES: DHA2 family efflux MFS transporter permease subunit [unclassified Streptomyces]MYW64803.1 DHA2 family efflux MFS transporter permease subunit [Streptomyces sp. SID8379]